MIVRWREIVLSRKPNGNKFNNGDRIKKREGFLMGTDGKNLAVACDDGVIRTVDLSGRGEDDQVYFEHEEGDSV